MNINFLILFCAFFILSLGILVLVKNPKPKCNQIFFLATIATFIWLSTYSLANNLSISLNQKILLLRIGYCAVNFIGILYFSFNLSFLEVRKLKAFHLFNYIYGLLI